MGEMKTLTIAQMNRELEADLETVVKRLESGFTFTKLIFRENIEAARRLCHDRGYRTRFTDYDGDEGKHLIWLRATAPDKDQ